MLGQIGPRQFDEWLAFRRVEWDPDELLIEVLKLGFAGLCAAWGGRVSPDDFDPRKHPNESREVSPEEAAAMARHTLPGARRTRQ